MQRYFKVENTKSIIDILWVIFEFDFSLINAISIINSKRVLEKKIKGGKLIAYHDYIKIGRAFLEIIYI